MEMDRDATYDWAFLDPLAFPPDLPPVMMIDLGGLGGFESCCC